MPTKTTILDYGNFVLSPELPENREFSEYLDCVDRALKRERSVPAHGNRSPFSPESQQRGVDLDDVLTQVASAPEARYTIKRVKQDPAFLPVSQFFARYRPISEPFSILHCNLDVPLHTKHRFQTGRDLAQINAALDEDTPFPWFQLGPHHQPCYLFGRHVWELKPSEARQTDEGIVLLFLETSEKHRDGRTDLGCAQTTITTGADFIPDKVRVLVWRRARGKCDVCGAHEGLEFDYLTPANKGGSPTPQNIRLLCARCYRQKNGGT